MLTKSELFCIENTLQIPDLLYIMYMFISILSSQSGFSAKTDNFDSICNQS